MLFNLMLFNICFDPFDVITAKSTFPVFIFIFFTAFVFTFSCGVMLIPIYFFVQKDQFQRFFLFLPACWGFGCLLQEVHCVFFSVVMWHRDLYFIDCKAPPSFLFCIFFPQCFFFFFKFLSCRLDPWVVEGHLWWPAGGRQWAGLWRPVDSQL